MRTAMITRRPPGYGCDIFAQHLRKTVSATIHIAWYLRPLVLGTMRE